jgi:hypothetical protein
MISEKISVIVIVSLSLLIVFILIKYLIIPELKKQRPNNHDLPYIHEKLDINGLKKISKKSLFGIGKIFMDENEYYFDNNSLFEYVKKEKYFELPLIHITHIIKTTLQVNNQSVWQIIFEFNGKKRQFKFLPSRAISNNNFIEFKKIIMDNHPSVRQSYFTVVEWEWKK